MTTDGCWNNMTEETAEALGYPMLVWDSPNFPPHVFLNDERERRSTERAWQRDRDERNGDVFIELLTHYSNVRQIVTLYVQNGGLLDVCHSDTRRYPYSPLEIAVRIKNSLALAQLLIESGAHPVVPGDKDGKYLYDVAKEKKNKAMHHYLWEAAQEYRLLHKHTIQKHWIPTRFWTRRRSPNSHSVSATVNPNSHSAS